MKNFIVTACACIMALHSSAQVSVGPVVGMHWARAVYKDAFWGFKRQYGNWHAGIQADIPISRSFSVRPSLYYDKCDYEFSSVNLSCIATYRLRMKNGSYFFAGAGPYLAFDTKKYMLPGMDSFSKARPIRWIKPLNFGVYASAGYQFKNGIFIMAHCQQIMNNMLHKDLEEYQFLPPDPSLRYDGYGMSAGCLFKLSKKKAATTEENAGQ